MRVVKAFARQRFEMDKFEKDNLEKFKRGKKLLTLHSFFWPVTDMICGLQILLGYYVGATMAINGTITVGTFLAYMGLIVWIIFPMRNLGRLIVQISTGMVSYNRVMDIISQEREPLDTGDYRPTTAPRGELAFENVGFEYEPGKPVLENISFLCKPGQVVALLGSTGSGKTTLVNLLPRFYDYTQGQHPAGWRRTEPLPAPLPAPAHRHRRAGTLPVLAHHPRKHHLWRWPRSTRCGSGSRRPRCCHP